MLKRTDLISRRAAYPAPLAALGFAATALELEALKPLFGAGTRSRIGPGTGLGLTPVPHPACASAAAALVRRTVWLSSPPVRPFFAVCALEGWRRVPAAQLADWSGIPLNRLKRLLAAATLTPAGVVAWNLALHAAWLLDVAALPPTAVVRCMGLGRAAGLAAALGARGVRSVAGRVEPGAFAATLDRYIALLRAGFSR